MLRKTLLACGIVASLLYVAADLLAAICYPEYHSFSARAISELMAHGAPTEQLVDPLFVLHGVFVIAFGVGVWLSAARNRALAVSGGMLIALGLLDLPGPMFFEMNVRGSAAPGAQDVLHIAVTALMVLVIMSAIAAAALARGPRFRVYSFATIAIMIAFGIATSFQAPQLAAGEPTHWMGITERINIGAYLLWQAVLAISLLPDSRSVRPVAARSAEIGRTVASGTG